MEQITLRVSADRKESLQGEADEAGRTLSEHIREHYLSRSEDGGESERVAELRSRVEEQRERIDDLRDDREEKIRLEARVEQLEQDLDRVREERDEARARANEATGKLKVHHSEKPGLVERAAGWLR